MYPGLSSIPTQRFIAALLLCFWLWCLPTLGDSSALAAAPAALKPTPLRIVDAAGRTVSLPDSPQRIVIVGRGPFMPLHLLYMFKTGAPRLVGVEERSQTLSFARLIDPQFHTKTILKPNPGPEQIAALKPDVVIIKGSSEDQTGLSLKRINIPVVYLGLEEPAQFLNDVRILGTLLGEPTRAEEIVRFYQSRLDLVRSRLADIPAARKPRVLVCAYHTRTAKTAVEVPASAWMQTIQVKASGGRPVWTAALKETDGWSIVNFEQIAAWNPDAIYVICWYTFDPTQVINTLRADPQWSRLKAVKSGRIKAVPSDLFGWDTPEPRWILGLTWMAAQTWPERFPDYSETGTIRAFFRELYHLDDKTIDRIIMPHMRPPA